MSLVNPEQMGCCDCPVNNVLQSIIWGSVVNTAHVMSHGRRLMVSYDLSWTTDRSNNLQRLEETPRCILNIPLVSPPDWEKPERIVPRCSCCCCWHLSACFDWYPICHLLLLEAQFQFHFVCWQISSAQTRKEWRGCEVVCFNHSGRSVTRSPQNSGKLQVV